MDTSEMTQEQFAALVKTLDDKGTELINQITAEASLTMTDEALDYFLMIMFRNLKIMTAEYSLELLEAVLSGAEQATEDLEEALGDTVEIDFSKLN